MKEMNVKGVFLSFSFCGGLVGFEQGGVGAALRLFHIEFIGYNVCETYFSITGGKLACPGRMSDFSSKRTVGPFYQYLQHSVTYFPFLSCFK